MWHCRKSINSFDIFFFHCHTICQHWKQKTILKMVIIFIIFIICIISLNTKLLLIIAIIGFILLICFVGWPLAGICWISGSIRAWSQETSSLRTSIQCILGKFAAVHVCDTGTIHLHNVLLGAPGDSRLGAGDGCCMWFVNSWTWSLDMQWIERGLRILCPMEKGSMWTWTRCITMFGACSSLLCMSVIIPHGSSGCASARLYLGQILVCCSDSSLTCTCRGSKTVQFTCFGGVLPKCRCTHHQTFTIFLLWWLPCISMNAFGLFKPVFSTSCHWDCWWKSNYMTTIVTISWYL